MQLISLWVKDFKNLKDFTINFENQENFKNCMKDFEYI